VPRRKGESVTISEDEGVRPDATAESLSKLRPAFTPDGTITAGSASPLSDGAAALVVMSAERARRQGLSRLAGIGAHGRVAGPDSSLHSQPARAIRRALEKAGRTPADLDLVEINEAFAQVVIQSIRELGVDPRIVNPNGGAIALGHPIGMSGARLVLTLALALRRRGGGLGAAGLCGGGGQGEALPLPAARGCPVGSPAPARTYRPVGTLVGRARAGDPRAVARLITMVESGHPSLPELAAALAPHTGSARVIGLTGAPGVGKSTVTSQLVGAFRAEGRRVGVLAVDPSSP